MKKIISLILTAIMMLSMSLCLFACGGDEQENEPPKNEKTNYTVTVVDQDGNPVKDVAVNFSVKGGITFPDTTKADGVVSYKTDKEVSVSILALPNGYEYDGVGKTLTLDKDGKVTVTVKKVEVVENYLTIRVVDEAGNPIAGVAVQMCNDSNCIPFGVTDEKGEATHVEVEGDFKACTSDDPDTKYPFVDGVATIVLSGSAN